MILTVANLKHADNWKKRSVKKYPTKKNENDPEAYDGMVNSAVDGRHPKLESKGSSRDTGVCFVRGKVCGTFAGSVPR